MDTVNYWTSYLLWTGLACNMVILCTIYYQGTHPKKRKASDKNTLIVVYRNSASSHDSVQNKKRSQLLS